MPERRILPNKLTYAVCITIPELVSCGISEKYLYTALSLQRTGKLSRWPHHKEGNKIFLHYNGLEVKYQQLVKEVVCNNINVEDYVKSQEVEESVVITNEIAEFFQDYKSPNREKLNPTKLKTYTRAAALLLFMSTTNTKEKRLKAFKITDINEYYQRISTYIKANKLPLPTNKGNLITKVKEFEKYGCKCVVSSKLGNNNSCKILTHEQNALLEAIASDFRNFDAAQTAMIYNEAAVKLDWKTIHPETARQYKIKHSFITIAGSRGVKEWEKIFSIQHKRIGPSMPLLYATLDGWDCELMYQKQVIKLIKGKKVILTEYANRHCIVIVLDPFNKYPLGYAIGDQESSNLIIMALKNTLDHIKSLTGHYYYPYQLQSDHYSLKRLTPFYEAMSHIYTPARVKNAKAKVIEPYFKYLNKNYCQFQPNWSGLGLIARRENQPNRDWLDTTKIKKQFPTKEGNLKQIQQIIEKERELKQAAWLDAFRMLDNGSLYEMTRETYLKTFGVITGDTNKSDGQGITISLSGKKFTWDTTDTEFRKHAFNNWTLILDPGDMSTALAITNDNKTEFLLTEKPNIHMAIHDQSRQDIDYKSSVRLANKEMMTEVTQRHADNRDVVKKLVEDNPILAETRAKLMLTDNGQQKDNLKNAEKAVRQLAAPPIDTDEEDIYIKMFDSGLCNPVETNNIDEYEQ